MIKKLNDVSPAVKRPMRVSDLQDVWDGLSNALASDTAAASTGPLVRIVSGFYLKGDGNLSAGTVAFNGNLYFHPDIDGFRITLGATVYASEASSGDQRVFADGTTQVFSFNRLATSTVGGSQIGSFTQAFIDANRAGFVAPGSIGTTQLAPDSVTTEKLRLVPFIATASMSYNGTAWTLNDFVVTSMGSKRPITATISASSTPGRPLVALQGVSYIASATPYLEVPAFATGFVYLSTQGADLPTAGLMIDNIGVVPAGAPFRVLIHGYQS